MFPKKQRLHTTNDILTVFRRGEVIRNGAIRLHLLPGTESLVTVIVDKKVSKLAVERNKVKRRVRAILKKYPLPQGKVIVRGFSGVEKLTFPQLENTISQGLKKVDSKK